MYKWEDYIENSKKSRYSRWRLCVFKVYLCIIFSHF